MIWSRRWRGVKSVSFLRCGKLLLLVVRTVAESGVPVNHYIHGKRGFVKEGGGNGSVNRGALRTVEDA